MYIYIHHYGNILHCIDTKLNYFSCPQNNICIFLFSSFENIRYWIKYHFISWNFPKLLFNCGFSFNFYILSFVSTTRLFFFKYSFSINLSFMEKFLNHISRNRNTVKVDIPSESKYLW